MGPAGQFAYGRAGLETGQRPSGDFMTDDLSQANRIGQLTTPLGDDVLALTRFDGGESLSELFEFRVEAVSKQENIDFNAALGKSVTVKLQTIDGQERYFNGLLAEARWAGQRDTFYVYQLTLKPWLWLLSLTSDCRIFEQLSAPDIVKQVFSDHGFSDFRDETKSSYPTLDYCVQYRETDFDFVSRLMEKFGIYYFFEYEDGKHTLVLADMKASHATIADLATVSYLPISVSGRQIFSISRSGRSAGSSKAAASSSTTTTTTSPAPTFWSIPTSRAATPTTRWRCTTTPANIPSAAMGRLSRKSKPRRPSRSTTGEPRQGWRFRSIPAAWSL